MNKFLLGMSIVGTASNQFAGAMADGKGTVGEMIDVAASTAQVGIQMTGHGDREIWNAAEGSVDVGAVGREVAEATRAALADGRLTVSDLPQFVGAIAKAACQAAGVKGKVVVDGTV